MNKQKPYNTTATELATLTERELWGIFVRHTVKTTLSMGPIIDVYSPDERLRDTGNYGIMDGFTNEVANDLEEHEEPGERLRCMINDLSDYVEELRQVSDVFVSIKESLAIDSDEDCDEHEVRYRVPVIQVSEAA